MVSVRGVVTAPFAIGTMSFTHMMGITVAVILVVTAGAIIAIVVGLAIIDLAKMIIIMIVA